MFETPYYHELIKKITIGFGALFSNLQIQRRDTNGIRQTIKVPIAYGPKEKYIQRADQDPDLDQQVMITLPRLAYEIVGYTFDGSRMTNRNNKIQCMKDGVLTAMYTPVPYNIDMQLSLLTKGTEDGLTIVEQILPLFTPEYSLTINAIPSMNLTMDMPIVLNNVSMSDEYEGDMLTRRLVTHTFDFTVKATLFGSISNRGVIRRTETTIPDVTQQHVSEGNTAGQIITDQWNDIL